MGVGTPPSTSDLASDLRIRGVGQGCFNLCPPLRPAKLPRVSSVLRGAGTRWYIHGARDPKAYAAVPASRASPFPIS